MGLIRIFLSILCLLLPFAYQKVFFFKLEPINISFQPDWEVFSPEVPSLSQPFTYFAEGTQAYVFLSKDQKTILKLFKGEKNIQQTLEACKLAYDMRDLTGVLFIHLNPKPGLPQFRIKDRWGKSHQIDPAETRFILQRRALPFFKTLCNASQKERPQLIQSFYALLQAMRGQGIANLDNSLGRNFGFIDGKAIAIDFGRFVFAPERVDEREAHLIRRLNKWLTKNEYP